MKTYVCVMCVTTNAPCINVERLLDFLCLFVCFFGHNLDLYTYLDIPKDNFCQALDIFVRYQILHYDYKVNVTKVSKCHSFPMKLS